MNRGFCILLAGLALALALNTGQARAYSYQTADLVLQGMDWVASGANNNRRQWYVDTGSGATYTNWTGWVEYQVNLAAGNWNFGLEVINRGYLGQGWYESFQIRDSITGQVMEAPASDTQASVVFRNVDIFSNGLYTIRYSFLNDKWDPKRERTHDANLQINKVFFDNTATIPGGSPGAAAPEPGSMLLLASGLGGLAAWRARCRHKKA